MAKPGVKRKSVTTESKAKIKDVTTDIAEEVNFSDHDSDDSDSSVYSELEGKE
jgi:hypothetical protein